MSKEDESMKTRDIDIRPILHANLLNLHKEEPDTIIVDELGVCQGDARVDVAVINGAMHGFEIKSESDTLDRLPNQLELYNKVFDLVTIITGENHVKKIKDLVPSWWGIIKVNKDSEGNVILIDIRKCTNNDGVDPVALVQLLWREEALDLLISRGLEKGYKSKPRKKIWERVVETVPLPELQACVRQQLKNRNNWRADLLQR